MKNNKDRNWADDIMEMCSILYCMKNTSMRETCMCWGFECGEGWKDPLKKLSCKLEALNLAYWPKYKIRIQADQVKEKYGTLHFYYSIHVDSVWYKRIPYKFLYALHEKLRKVDYAVKEVEDSPYHVEHVVEELKSKVEYVKAKHTYANCSNVHVEEKDGHYYKHSDVDHYRECHYEPTKHKMLFKLKKPLWKLACMFDRYADRHSLSNEKKVILEYLEALAEKYVAEAEDECYNTCERCGTHIGTDWSPRCSTSGWITYICDECADSQDYEYYKNGERWQKGKMLASKEEVEAEHSKIDAKYAELDKKYDAEQAEYERELKEAEEEDKKSNEDKK